MERKKRKLDGQITVSDPLEKIRNIPPHPFGVKPIGNSFLDKNYVDMRSPCLGHFNVIDDSLLLDILT
jgi:hypothetical protein